MGGGGRGCVFFLNKVCSGNHTKKLLLTRNYALVLVSIKLIVPLFL